LSNSFQHRSATRGDSVEYGDGDVKGVSAIETDADIGDYVQHTYTVSTCLSAHITNFMVL